MKFDKNGMLKPQKVSYKIKHDDQSKELIKKLKIEAVVISDNKRK